MLSLKTNTVHCFIPLKSVAIPESLPGIMATKWQRANQEPLPSPSDESWSQSWIFKPGSHFRLSQRRRRRSVCIKGWLPPFSSYNKNNYRFSIFVAAMEQQKGPPKMLVLIINDRGVGLKVLLYISYYFWGTFCSHHVKVRYWLWISACPLDLRSDRHFLKGIPRDYKNIYAKCWVFPVFSTLLLTTLWQRLHCLYL